MPSTSFFARNDCCKELFARSLPLRNRDHHKRSERTFSGLYSAAANASSPYACRRIYIALVWSRKETSLGTGKHFIFSDFLPSFFLSFLVLLQIPFNFHTNVPAIFTQTYGSFIYIRSFLVFAPPSAFSSAFLALLSSALPLDLPISCSHEVVVILPPAHPRCILVFPGPFPFWDFNHAFPCCPCLHTPLPSSFFAPSCDVSHVQSLSMLRAQLTVIPFLDSPCPHTRRLSTFTKARSSRRSMPPISPTSHLSNGPSSLKRDLHARK